MSLESKRNWQEKNKYYRREKRGGEMAAQSFSFSTKVIQQQQKKS